MCARVCFKMEVHRNTLIFLGMRQPFQLEADTRNADGTPFHLFAYMSGNFTLANLKLQLEDGFTKVTPSICTKIIKKIKAREDQFWNEDMLLDPSE